MSDPNQELNELHSNYEQTIATSIHWLNLVQANVAKAILGQVYANHLSPYLKKDHMKGHNGLALTNALVAGAGFLTSAALAEDTAAQTRVKAASLGMPVPEWAVRRPQEEYED